MHRNVKWWMNSISSECCDNCSNMCLRLVCEVQLSSCPRRHCPLSSSLSLGQFGNVCPKSQEILMGRLVT